MDKGLSPQLGSTSNPIMRKPSFRSEIKIHFPPPNRLIFQNNSEKQELTSSGEVKITCLPPVGKNNTLLQANKSKNSNKLSKFNQSKFSQSSDNSSNCSPSPINYNHSSSPLVKKFIGDFKRSSSVHSSSFLYPKKEPQSLQSIEPPPDQSQDDTCLSKSNSLKRNDNSRSSDHLLEEKIIQRRNESFKSEKRHSLCAMESEIGEGDSLEKSKQNLDTMSLKPGNSTLSISKPNWFFKKYVERQESKLSRKSASCRDLGGVDCEGWLWKKHEKSGKKMIKWVLWWCVLEKKEIKFYKQKELRSCEGSIYLPGMRIAPAPELDLKKGAFKVFHAGSTFYFRADKREDMVKWMNKMSLATLSNFEVQSSKLIAGFQNEEESEYSSQRSFSSEGDDSLSSGSSSPSLSGENHNRNSRSYEHIIEGQQTVQKSSQIKHYQLRSKFISLSKLLEEKEKQLSTIKDFTSNRAITGDDLKRFIESQSAAFLRMSEEIQQFTKPDLIITSPSINESPCEDENK